LYKTAFKFILNILVIFVFISYLLKNKSLFNNFSDLNAGVLFLFGSLVICTWFVNSYQLVAFVKIKNLKLGLWENFLLTVKSNLLNYLPLKPGLIIRSLELKRRNKLQHRDFLTFLLVRFAHSFCNQLLFLILISFLFIKAQLVFSGLFLYLCLIYLAYKVLLSFSKMNFKNRFFTIILKWIDDSFLKSLCNISFYSSILITNIFQMLLIYIRFYIASIILNVDVNTIELLIFIPFVIISNYINIVPGNLLVRELIVGFVAYMIGFDFKAGFEIAMIDRMMILVVSGMSLLIYTLLNVFKLPSIVKD